MAGARTGQGRELNKRGIAAGAYESPGSFFASVERRAFVIARFAAGNTDDAHDIVQDAMLQLVRSYAKRGEQEWGALFHTILQSRISDWRRRAKVRNRFRVWFGSKHEDEYGERGPRPRAEESGRPGR